MSGKQLDVSKAIEVFQWSVYSMLCTGWYGQTAELQHSLIKGYIRAFTDLRRTTADCHCYGINEYEWIQSQAIKPPLVLCKWASSTSVVHISLHNPIRGVWAAVKWPVALLITLAALLHLRPTFIKWATCLFLDVIKVCCWRRGDEYIIMFSGNVTDIPPSPCVIFAVLLFNVMGLIFLPAKVPACRCRRCRFQALDQQHNKQAGLSTLR